MSRGAGRGIVTVEPEINEAIVVYESGDDLYVCKAPIGSALASEVWQVRHIDTSSGVVVKYADGDDFYDNAATNLAMVAGYSYS